MRMRTSLAAAATSTGILAALVVATPTVASPSAPTSAPSAAEAARPTAKKATAIGTGGAVSRPSSVRTLPDVAL